MKRRLVVVLAGLLAAVAGAVLAAILPAKMTETQPPRDPSRVYFSQLPPLVYARGQFVGQRVRVAFYRPLTPTADATVYHFHPGEPVQVTPATYRLHFAEPPTFGEHVVVVGTVEGIEADYVKRINGVPGVLVLRGCRVPQDVP